MASDDLCPRCKVCPETAMHVIRDCEDVQHFWYSFVHPDHVSRFFSIGLEGWLNLNLSNTTVGHTCSDWQTFFGIAIYELWRDRNRLVFSNSSNLGQGLQQFVESQFQFVVHTAGLHGLRADLPQRH